MQYVKVKLGKHPGSLEMMGEILCCTKKASFFKLYKLVCQKVKKTADWVSGKWEGVSFVHAAVSSRGLSG